MKQSQIYIRIPSGAQHKDIYICKVDQLATETTNSKLEIPTPFFSRLLFGRKRCCCHDWKHLNLQSPTDVGMLCTIIASGLLKHWSDVFWIKKVKKFVQSSRICVPRPWIKNMAENVFIPVTTILWQDYHLFNSSLALTPCDLQPHAVLWYVCNANIYSSCWAYSPFLWHLPWLNKPVINVYRKSW